MKIFITLFCLYFVHMQTEAQTGSNMNLMRSLKVHSPESPIPDKNPAHFIFNYTVYIHPAKGIFNLLMEGDFGLVSSLILDNIFGKCIFNSQIHTSRHKLTGIANGIYFVRFISEDKIITRKIAIGEVKPDLNRFALVDLN